MVASQSLPRFEEITALGVSYETALILYSRTGLLFDGRSLTAEQRDACFEDDLTAARMARWMEQADAERELQGKAVYRQIHSARAGAVVWSEPRRRAS